jgi:uncharacterized SAM-binding protein YcdF (DUF218 family)
MVAVTFSPLTIWWTRALSGPLTEPQGEILIVLAGSSAARGSLGYSSYLRAQYALWAYQGGSFQQIVVSGGGQPPVSVAIKNFLVAEGVPPDRIRVETNSTNTHENAMQTRALLAGRPGPFVLLTSDYHMFRARRAFRNAGLNVLPRPIPDSFKRATRFAGRWPAFLDLLEESAKIAYYRLRGWI